MTDIIQLNDQLIPAYLCCLEDWSPEMKEAGEHKARWFQQMHANGLRVQMAREEGRACGMIHYLPIEHSFVEGSGLHVINCIWVHGHPQGVGNRQRKGLGTALLEAAEEDAWTLGAKGMVAWGIMLPFWMKASWYHKHGYRPVDRVGIMQLLWKPFTPDAQPPRWIRPRKRPQPVAGKVTVTTFVNGWCQAQNIAIERAKRAAREFGSRVVYQEISTLDRKTFLEWGISDALFVDDKEVNTGPPPTYEKLRGLIAKQVRRLK